jgi:two-component system, sensor histidine kinase and response regulator
MVPAMLSSQPPDVKFLLVDDLEENLFALEQMLSRDGLQLVSVGSGRAALEAMLVHDFALAIIDVQMPEMDGIELAEVMRSADRTRHLPIIFVTAATHERRNLFRGYEAGAVDFLYKPIEPVVLRNKAETFFELYRQKQQLAAQLEMLHQLNEDSRRARDAAEAANRAKDEFLANVSHEIRTPMNAILGMTELVLDTSLDQGQRHSLDIVRAAAGNLLGTINDLLDFSKIEAGKLELDETPFLLRAAVGEAVRSLAIRAHRQGLELICDVHPDAPDRLFGDVGRLRQVLINLVGNAIKFTEKGEIVVEIAAEESPGEVVLRGSVRDTGIGIPPEKQERIFRAFEQQDSSTTRKYGGTGLGLSIATRLIELMGGKLTVESEPGQGSTFHFTARLSPQAGPPGAFREGLSLYGMRALIVDDSVASRRALATWLGESGATCSLAGDAASAMAALAEPEKPALVLLDASMPGTDTVALAAEIRALPEACIVVLGSGDRPGDPEKFRAQQVDGYLLKPVLRDELLQAVESAMQDREESPPPAARQPPPSQVELRVLVTEDNEFNSELLQRLLAGRGHEVELARTGREALQKLETRRYDLLLLDVHMPELDGFQAIASIRRREREKGGHLPVIAVTARSRKEDRERCLAAGMDEFLVKPIDSAELWSAIERVTTKRELLSPQIILAACGGDAAILTGICATLARRLPLDLAALQEAFAKRDARGLREVAHTFGAMLAAFSDEAGALVFDVEDLASRGLLGPISPLVARLHALAPELLRQVAQVSIESLRASVPS